MHFQALFIFLPAIWDLVRQILSNIYEQWCSNNCIFAILMNYLSKKFIFLIIIGKSHFRLYGPRCGGCGEGISPSELIRKAKDKVFHVKCFICQVSSFYEMQLVIKRNHFRSAENSCQLVRSSTSWIETSSYARMTTTVSKTIKVWQLQKWFIMLLNSFKTQDGFHLMFEL